MFKKMAQMAFPMSGRDDDRLDMMTRLRGGSLSVSDLLSNREGADRRQFAQTVSDAALEGLVTVDPAARSVALTPLGKKVLDDI